MPPLTAPPQILNALIQAGANVSLKDHAGKTALDYARESNSLKESEACKALESAGK